MLSWEWGCGVVCLLCLLQPVAPGAAASPAIQIDRTVKQLRKEVKADPAKADLHYQLATALSELGRTDLQRFGRRMADRDFGEAIAEYRKTVELDPSNAEARKSLVSELEFQGEFSEARAQLREIAKLDPGDASAHLELARADLRQDGGDLNEAIAEFHATLQSEPQNSGAWNDLGDANVRAGKFEAAAAAYTEALKLQPDDDTAQFSLGEALRRAGKLDQAVDHYREAIRLNAQWKEMLTTNLSTDLAAKNLDLAKGDATVLEKLGYPIDPQLMQQLKALEPAPK